MMQILRLLILLLAIYIYTTFNKDDLVNINTHYIIDTWIRDDIL